MIQNSCQLLLRECAAHRHLVWMGGTTAVMYSTSLGGIGTACAFAGTAPVTTTMQVEKVCATSFSLSSASLACGMFQPRQHEYSLCSLAQSFALEAGRTPLMAAARFGYLEVWVGHHGTCATVACSKRLVWETRCAGFCWTMVQTAMQEWKDRCVAAGKCMYCQPSTSNGLDFCECRKVKGEKGFSPTWRLDWLTVQ